MGGGGGGGEATPAFYYVKLCTFVHCEINRLFRRNTWNTQLNASEC